MKKVVPCLIAVNAAVFVAQFFWGDFLLLHFALWPIGRFRFPGLDETVGFEPWQLITSAFLHAPFEYWGLAHIGFNMFGLWSFGRFVVRELGAPRFLLLYFASVLASALVQLVYVTATADTRLTYTVGASGGVFGVLLAFGWLFPQSRVILLIPPIPMKAWVMVVSFAVIELLLGVFGTFQGVAHFAHLGGMLGALLVMLILQKKAAGL